MLHWSIGSPFAILRVYLWMICHHTDSNDNMTLMNTMCDMSKFVVVVHVLDVSSATLASHYIRHVLINLDCVILLCRMMVHLLKEFVSLCARR